MKRIICIGNRYVPGDDVGPRVYDRLQELSLPPDVEVMDGGLGGLRLLAHALGVERVVFVDAVCGFGAPGEVRVLDAADVAASAPASFDHAAGLAYLVRVLLEMGAPPMFVVGVETGGSCSTERACELALEIALQDAGGVHSHARAG